MSAHRHLNLHLFRLKPLQDWNIPREGLFFLFPRAGAGEYVCDSSRYAIQIECGDVLVLQNGSGGKVCAGLEAELTFYAFSIGIEHLFPSFVAEEIALVQPLLDELKTARLHPAVSSAAAGWHQLVLEIPRGSDLEHRTQLLRVAGAILSEEFKKLRPPLSLQGRVDAHITRLFEQLSVDQILNLSVEEMARRFGCSQRQLNRLFNEHFGLSVGMLRMEMRLLKAVPLLRNPELKIIQVAKQCGFNHSGLFHACFKRRFGLSPGQWRRNVADDEEPGRALTVGRPSCRMREFGLCPLDEPLREFTEAGPACGSSAAVSLESVPARLESQRVQAPA